MKRPAATAALVIVAAAAVMYAPTIHDYFLQDDFGVVGLFSQRSIAYFPRWFVAPWTEDVWGYVPDEIRPFPALSYTLMAWLGAGAPEPNHVLNIAIHALNGLLVMWIAEAAAGLALVPATFAGLVFVLLPIQAESVAWVTGRVDSLPTAFYFASFLLFVRWRRGARRSAYLWSLSLFFAALFSKQNTITMAPALLLFDWLVDRRRIEMSWAWLRPYVPYALLTIGFLALRYALFHEVARESTLSAQRFQEFLSDSSRHLVRLVFGGPGLRPWSWRDSGVIALGVALTVVRAFTMARWQLGGKSPWRQAIYFGAIWVAMGMAPILVSGYYSPRHMYLASLGWAVALGIALDVFWPRTAGRQVVRLAAGLAIPIVATVYALQLRAVVRDWNTRAAISRAALTRIERESMTSPRGTLIVAGVPGASWNFAIPHALRPPFTAADLTARVQVISDSSDHCCDAVHWTAYTRDALRTWQAARAPVIALYWDPNTGVMSRVSDSDDPQLRTLVSLLAETSSRETLDSEIRGLLNDYVALR